MIVFSVWSGVSFLTLHTEHLELKIIYQFVAFTAQTAISPLLFLFVIHFTEKKRWTKPLFTQLVWVLPVINLLLALTNEYHGLVYSEIYLEGINSQVVGIFKSGPIIYVNLIYSYGLILIGLLWLVRYFLQFKKSGIISSVMIIATSLITLVVNTLHVTGYLLNTPIDTTPHTFSLLALALFWSINQQQLFRVSPIAYKNLLRNMPNGIIVTNNDDLIIETNQAACDFLNYQQEDIQGKFIQQVAPFLCDYDPQCFQNQNGMQKEIELPGLPQRFVKVQMQQVCNKKDNLIGKIITIHDISDLRKTENELRKRNEFTNTLVDATAEINKTLDLKKVLDKILDNVAKVVPYDEADIVLIDESGNYKFVSFNNLNDEHPMDFVFDLEPMSKDLLGFVKMAKSGEIVLIKDTKDDPNWNPNLEGTEWIKSYLGVPIQYRGEILGFLNLAMGTANAFNWEQAQQIQIFANYAASAIANARLFDKTQRIAMEMSALNEINQMIIAGTGLSETIIAALRQLKIIVPIDVFGITLLNKKTYIVETYLYYSDENKIDIPPFNYYSKDSITRNVFERQKSLYVPDIYADNSMIKTDDITWIDKFHSHTLFGTPLINRGEIFGIMIIGCNQVDAYSPEQIELLETVALQSSTAIDNARLFEQVQEQAITDELTGLDNRRHFNILIDKEINRAQRYEHQLSLIMFDIDDFKDVNDQYGHLVGDFILREIAAKTRECLRKTDTAFRYGGEEFVVIFPDTPIQPALEIAERIRKTIEDHQFHFDKMALNVTVSLGVCEFTSEYHDATSFIANVDKALYAAKSAGKNCVRKCSIQ
jgi:diguanylate cyclase (GGDEF)-like protein/PAS domain S-box-containing protein